MTLTSLFTDMAGYIPRLKRKPRPCSDYANHKEESTFQKVFKEEEYSEMLQSEI